MSLWPTVRVNRMNFIYQSFSFRFTFPVPLATSLLIYARICIRFVNRVTSCIMWYLNTYIYIYYKFSQKTFGRTMDCDKKWVTFVKNEKRTVNKSKYEVLILFVEVMFRYTCIWGPMMQVRAKGGADTVNMVQLTFNISTLYPSC